jgi:uncharacterized membrane protein
MTAHSRFVKWQAAGFRHISRRPRTFGAVAIAREWPRAILISATQTRLIRSAAMNALSLPFTTLPAAARFDIGPVARTAVSLACFTMSFAVIVALGKAALGMIDNLHHYAKLPIIIHVAAVLPTIPLGGWLLLARKGTALHKQLGKVWLVLMLITATSAIFIQSNGTFSWIHLFVPMTFHAAWKVVATARRGDIQAHKRHLVFTYLTALMLPGIAAFVLPGRLMNVMLLG